MRFSEVGWVENEMLLGEEGRLYVRTEGVTSGHVSEIYSKSSRESVVPIDNTIHVPQIRAGAVARFCSLPTRLFFCHS